jgi:ribosome-binding protein aMBF1 (putative translation factor)
MTIIYCDLCGRSLEKGDAGNRIKVSEYGCDSCDDCAKKLIKYLKSGPWKAAQGTAS